MNLVVGSRIGSYEIVSPLGAGGMGEVYRARDPKLNRDVAIKVLLPVVANDPDRLARFSREAQVLASLNHPNIAHIYGVEEANGVTALVMELVDGEDLSQRMSRGAIPIDEALPIARQIADALEAAHDHGIIHRDLKPANIKLRSDGTVKVLDFGLAKQGSGIGDQGSAGAANSPTLSLHATEAGIILGTAAYMSPEQAAGKSVDKRSDLWAFGVVLFEMLTGRQLFSGETVSHVLAAVLKDEPAWATLPPNTPPSIRRLLRRALEKDRKRRLTDAASARLDIDDALTPSMNTIDLAASSAPPVTRRWVQLLPWALALVAVATVAWRWPGSFGGPPPTSLRPIRFTVAQAGTVMAIAGGSPQMAISPDGSRIALVLVDRDNRRRIWIRPLEALSAQALPGTENALSPFWSPDSKSIGFFADGKVKRLELAGAAEPQPVGSVPFVRGATWSTTGVMLIASRDGLYRLPVSGGEPTQVVATEPNSNDDVRWPYFLPDGRHFIYVVSSSDATRKGVFVGSLDSPDRKRLTDGDSTVAFAASGHLIFAKQAALFAQPFDLQRLELTGDPLPLADRVARGLPATYAAFDVSQTGVLIYRTSEDEEAGSQQLVWLDRAGKQVATVGSPGQYRVLTLSADGRKIAFDRIDPERGTRDAWSVDVARGFLTRLTSHPANDFAPLWSPDGTRVMFASDRDGPQAALYQGVETGGAPDELMLGSGGDKRVHDWSRDARYVLYSATRFDTAASIRESTQRSTLLWALPMFGDRRPLQVSPQDATSENRGHFSPDSRFIAFDSTASGGREVYVKPFPPTGQQWRVSADGGYEARWSADGTELFYLGPDGTLMAVDIKMKPAFTAGVPHALFTQRGIRPGGATEDRVLRSTYAVSTDPQRFLFASNIGEVTATPITVVLNWHVPLRNGR